MFDLIWYFFSFLLGGIIGAPLLLGYAFYTLQKYIESPPADDPFITATEETETEEGPTLVSKVGWLRITHEEKSAGEGNSNITELLTNSFNSFMERKQPGPLKRGKDSVYGVLKADTLMVYDSGSRLECRGVIILTEYLPSIHPESLADSEAFKKDHPIRLKHKAPENCETDNLSTDYFVYLDSPVEKESWFIALLNASRHHQEPRHPDPLAFDRSAIEGLINTINSNDDHQQTKWLNALIGRIFLGIYKTQAVKDFFINKIATKTTKVKKPGFLGEIHVRDLRVGNSIPYITNPKLLGLSKEGELTAEMDLEYSGGFKAEIETEASISVTSRLKPLKVNMVLAVVLKSLSGKILLRVKPPPTNRFWIGFYEAPQMSLSIEPMVSDTQIKSNMILQAIERRIIEMIKESVVLPNMDDFCFFPSYGTGGIFNFVPDTYPLAESDEEKVDKSDKTSATTKSELGSSLDEINESTELFTEQTNYSRGDSFEATRLASRPVPPPPTTFEKLRNLKDNYFGAKRPKPRDGAASPLVPGSPASMSMPNLFPIDQKVETKSSLASPAIASLDDSDLQSELWLDNPSPSGSPTKPDLEVDISAPQSAALASPADNVRKRKIIPNFVKLKEQLNTGSFAPQRTSSETPDPLSTKNI